MMKKFFLGALSPCFAACLLGCSSTGEKSANLSFIYGIAAVISLLLLIVCCFLVRKKEPWFLLLFTSVFVVNIGYTMLALSPNLEMALMANRISYLGSVFLPLSMLLTILRVAGIPCKKALPYSLLAVAVVVFCIAASPGILDIYYKEVSFEVVNGVSRLIKVYGPLHPIYMVYLLGYFGSMVVMIAWVSAKKLIENTAYAIILAIAVFVNICVWLIEQFVQIDFEMLSISYIISESFLLGIHCVMQEQHRLKNLVKKSKIAKEFTDGPNAEVKNPLETQVDSLDIDTEALETFTKGIARLTPTEKIIFDAYVSRATSKEVMELLNIKENTLKYHNRNIYSKLGISSRKEMQDLYRHLKTISPKTDEA